MAGGEIVTLSRQKDGERFAGAVVALGGLGVIHKVVASEVQPTFQVQTGPFTGYSLFAARLPTII